MQIPPVKIYDLLLLNNWQTTRLDTRAKESAENVRRYGHQHEGNAPTPELAHLGNRCERFDRTGQKATHTQSKKTERLHTRCDKYKQEIR